MNLSLANLVSPARLAPGRLLALGLAAGLSAAAQPDSPVPAAPPSNPPPHGFYAPAPGVSNDLRAVLD